LFYTSQPVLALGIFDQDVDEKMSLRYPKLYTPGLESSSFNKQEFFKSALQGFLTSCVLFFLTYGAYGDKIMANGQTLNDHQLFGTVVATCLVIIVNLQVALDSSYWTYFNHVTIWGSIAVYFLLQFSVNYILVYWGVDAPYVGCLTMALSDYTFYVTCALISVVSLLPVVAFRFYRTDVTPTLADKARLLQRQRNSEERKKVQKDFKVFSGRRSRRSTRSAYAFAHEEGFGKLITSGRIMAKQPNREVLPALNKSKKTASTQQQHNQRQRNRDTDIPNAVITDS